MIDKVGHWILVAYGKIDTDVTGFSYEKTKGVTVISIKWFCALVIENRIILKSVKSMHVL